MQSNPAPVKRLYRSRVNSRIAGVCGGLGDYFDVDPVWMRLLFILFILAGGCGFLVYFIFWLIVPLAPVN